MDLDEQNDRRRAQRHRVTFRVVFDHAGNYCQGTVVDVSATGVRLRVRKPISVGTTVAIVPVGEAGEILFDVPASVVRVIPCAGDEIDLGLEFTRLDAERLAALQKLFAAMPVTDDEALTVGKGRPPGIAPADPREPSHHRIRARLRATPTRDPRSVAKPL